MKSFPNEFQPNISRNKLAGLWQLMKGFRRSYFIATLALSVAALSKTTTYLLLQYFIDSVLNENQLPPFSTGRISAMIVIAVGFVSLALLEGGSSFLSGRMAAFTAEGITRRLRNYLFDHIQRLTFSYHDRTQTGELIQRVTSDVDALRRFFADQAIGVGRVLVIFTINFVAIWRLKWELALVSIIVVPFIVIISAYFFKRISKSYEQYQEQEAKLSTTLQENLSGVRVVKAFTRQTYEIDKFNEENLEKYRRGKNLVLRHTFFWPVSDILSGLQLMGGLFYAAYIAIQGELTVGMFLAYTGLVGWLIWPMRNLGRLIIQTSTGLVSYGRVMEIIRQDREPIEAGKISPSKDIHGDIKFDGVCFKYEEGPPTLKDINFESKAGQVVALLGSTGSGKSTLVNLLPRFYEYTSGKILLDGVELKDYPRSFLRQQIGIVEQEPFLFSRSIRENITYGVGREIAFPEVEKAARFAAIHDVIQSFPDGYDTIIGEKGVTLSGGQKQRVAIARTLLKNPRLLIFDDSTSSVDTETEALIRQAMEALMKDRTTFIIAHRIQSVMNADLILVLDKGELVEKGSHAELMVSNGMYRNTYEIQTQIEDELEKELGLELSGEKVVSND